jgi:hypothetical protein
LVPTLPIACSAFIVPLCAISFLAPAETTSENRFVGEEDIEAGGECVDIHGRNQWTKRTQKPVHGVMGMVHWWVCVVASSRTVANCEARG